MKPWWPEVARVESTGFATHGAAAEYERATIADLRPAHNLIFHPDYHPTPTYPAPTPIDVTAIGPEELLSYGEIVDYAASRGIRMSRSSLRAYRSTGRMPPPDDQKFAQVPRWKRETIDRWLDDRPGQGYRSDLRGAKTW
jgi:hypothetical protein